MKGTKLKDLRKHYRRVLPRAGKIGKLMLYTNSIKDTLSSSQILAKSIFCFVTIKNSDRIFNNVISWFQKSKITSRPLMVRGVDQFLPGIHIGMFKGIRVIVTPTKESDDSDLGGNNLNLIFLTTNTEILREFILEMNENNPDNLMKIHLPTSYGWTSLKEAPGRRWDTIYLNKGLLETFQKDLTDFLSKKARYEKFGIPYRRSYLLHGPPGTGKTSLAKVIATELDRPMYPLNTASGLESLNKDCPPRAIVLIEDFDTLLLREDIDTNEKNKKMTKSGFSISSFLNFLDGALSTEDRILICTTNYIQEIPEELIRPGRIDVILEIGYMELEPFLAMCNNYYPEWNNDILLTDIFNNLKNITPAQLQEALLLSDDINVLLNKVKQIQKDHYAN